jgi:DNA ligase-1
MKAFVELYKTLDQTSKSTIKIQALVNFFEEATEQDKLHAIALLSGKRPKRAISTALLRTWTAEAANLPYWLFEESYHVVGDLAETMALLAPQNKTSHNHSLHDLMLMLSEIKHAEEAEKKRFIHSLWNRFNKDEKFVFHKLLTGGWRVGVSQKTITKALAQFTGEEEAILTHRLMGNFDPLNTTFEAVVLHPDPNEQASKPYPFFLAYPLEDNPSSALGLREDWQVEYKWDGIRGQIVMRNQETFIWSRGEESVTEQFPELTNLHEFTPEGTVLDGEILVWINQQPGDFAQLQKRLGRKRVSKKLMETNPVAFMAYDILEFEGTDVRNKPMKVRRAMLEQVVCHSSASQLLLSPLVQENNWEDIAKVRETATEKRSEGLMLKNNNSAYGAGRKRGDWFKWKVDPLTIDAVLIYAMRGHGRRANLYTDYTFAVWNNGELVPVTKAYSGLTDAEFRQVDAFVKKNTLERFGPVRSVKPELVFEIAFEGIAKSTRHKSGVALRFPRMARWRKDKPKDEANTLDDLMRFIH